jgi:uncharacterized iron-regulated protein
VPPIRHLATAPLLLVLAAGALACAAPREAWVAEHGRGHPLAGRVREVASGRFLEPEALFDRLARADFVLLGERHDHPDHHRLQARTIDALVARGRRPALAFEMLAADEGPAVAAARGSGAEAIRAAVRWDESGWPPWPLYAPLFEAALRAGLPIVAANLSRRDAAALRADGLEGVEPELRAQLGLDAPAPAAEVAALAQQISDSHCGFAPAAALPRMVVMQRAWNARLADALLEAHAQGADGAVLVAGAEHARHDVGAPAALALRAPEATVASLAFLEVDPDPLACEGEPATEERAQRFDYVWYTPRVELEDPCAKYREQLERLGAPPHPPLEAPARASD